MVAWSGRCGSAAKLHTSDLSTLSTGWKSGAVTRLTIVVGVSLGICCTCNTSVRHFQSCLSPNSANRLGSYHDCVLSHFARHDGLQGVCSVLWRRKRCIKLSLILRCRRCWQCRVSPRQGLGHNREMRCLQQGLCTGSQQHNDQSPSRTAHTIVKTSSYLRHHARITN